MTDPATRWRIAAVAAASLLPLSAARAEPSIADLLQRIEEQDQKILALQRKLDAQEQQEQTQQEQTQQAQEQEQKVLVLERKLEIQEEANKAALASTPVVKAGPRGFSIQSADGQNQLKFRGVLQVDGRFLTNDDPRNPPDTWQVTRARPILEGTLGGIYDFRFTPDFGQGRTVIQDAYITARFRPDFQVTTGKFKSPVGLERLQSANDIRLVARAFPTQIAPNRDIGVQVGGGLFGDRLNYAVAYLNGSNDGSSSDSFTPADQDPNSDEGVGRPPVRAPVRGKRHFRAARVRHRHRLDLHGPGGHHVPDAAAHLPHVGAGTVLPVPHRRDGDDRERLARAPGATALLLRRIARPDGRVHARFAGRLALRRRCVPRGHHGHLRVAADGVVLPHRRGGGVPGLQAELDFLAGQTAPGERGNSSRGTMCSTRTTRRSRAERRPSPTRTRRPRRRARGRWA